MAGLLPPLIFPDEGYDITNQAVQVIPQEFRNMVIEHALVEFLKVGTDNTPVEIINAAKNHVILKLDFRHGGYDGYEGVRINVLPNIQEYEDQFEDGSAYQPGKLCVKPVAYPGLSHSSARTCQIDFVAGKTLDWVLGVLCTRNLMHFFSFVVLNDRYYGCRDFITQTLYQLHMGGATSGCITSTAPVQPTLPAGVTSAFTALGFRYMAEPLGQPYPCPVDRGLFQYYQRVEMAYMPYEVTHSLG
ncbi:hypothetical protein SPI_09308 [Niveomyces insectorum RCEF 264]|uniref:Uncharacterized protein n=1 Tax=Niveomyces insectorum RCEF 264 TaxID=1081102 RepID=A0A167LWF9_9HYPO|nr:hypothetical protein SPI_09308 [Niveomyces insectorum RCEF 264]